jgi:hypothetical protein
MNTPQDKMRAQMPQPTLSVDERLAIEIAQSTNALAEITKLEQLGDAPNSSVGTARARVRAALTNLISTAANSLDTSAQNVLKMIEEG